STTVYSGLFPFTTANKVLHLSLNPLVPSSRGSLIILEPIAIGKLKGILRATVIGVCFAENTRIIDITLPIRAHIAEIRLNLFHLYVGYNTSELRSRTETLI